MAAANAPCWLHLRRMRAASLASLVVVCASPRERSDSPCSSSCHQNESLSRLGSNDTCSAFAAHSHFEVSRLFQRSPTLGPTLPQEPRVAQRALPLIILGVLQNFLPQVPPDAILKAPNLNSRTKYSARAHNLT